MISFPMPDPFYGPILEDSLTEVELESEMYYSNGRLVLSDLDEDVRPQVETLVDAHPGLVSELQALNETKASNESTLRAQAKAAYAGNKTFLDLQSPTNVQVLAQVKFLTRQMQGMIRLVNQEFDSVE